MLLESWKSTREAREELRFAASCHSNASLVLLQLPNYSFAYLPGAAYIGRSEHFSACTMTSSTATLILPLETPDPSNIN